jgi:polyadenylate-binding protein
VRAHTLSDAYNSHAELPAQAEKALATVHGRPIPDTPSVTLHLSPFPATNPPTAQPPPAAQPRLVKHLPPGSADATIYDLFRPYGALANVRAGVTGPDSALVEFWREEDARAASEALHCAEVGGSSIAIQLYQPRRAPAAAAPELHANAPTFVPGGGPFSYPAGPNVSPPDLLYVNVKLDKAAATVLPQPTTAE